MPTSNNSTIFALASKQDYSVYTGSLNLLQVPVSPVKPECTQVYQSPEKEAILDSNKQTEESKTQETSLTVHDTEQRHHLSLWQS